MRTTQCQFEHLLCQSMHLFLFINFYGIAVFSALSRNIRKNFLKRVVCSMTIITTIALNKCAVHHMLSIQVYVHSQAVSILRPPMLCNKVLATMKLATTPSLPQHPHCGRTCEDGHLLSRPTHSCKSSLLPETQQAVLAIRA